MWSFYPSHYSHVFPFSLSLVEEGGQVLLNGNWSVDPGTLMDEHLSDMTILIAIYIDVYILSFQFFFVLLLVPRNGNSGV